MIYSVRLSPRQLVLAGELDSRLDRLRAGSHEEQASIGHGQIGRQPIGQIFQGLAGEHGGMGVGNLGQLHPDRLGDLPHPMPDIDHHRPARRVDVALAVRIPQVNALPMRCSTCGLCLERCQMAAIKKGEDSYQIIDGRCIGCGLCVSACPTEAISMVTKLGMEPPPKDFLQDTLQRIRAERQAIEIKKKGTLS